MENKEVDQLLFRRQYLLGTSGVEYTGWKKLDIPKGYILSVHPDLDVTQYHGQNYDFTLLGYLLDPLNPSHSNQQVLKTLDLKVGDISSLLDQLYDKSGHYVLFVFNENFEIVLNDAGGLKQVLYYQDESGKPWLSSHSALIALKKNLPVSEAASRYMNSEKYKKKLEPWWPADCTPYEGVHHLQPNHYLDLKTLTPVRFWPYQKLKHYTLREGTRIMGDLLKGTCQAGQNRFKGALTLTGGYDTRVILAACRDFIDDMEVFSMLYRNLKEQDPDMVIAREIARAMKLNYHLIDCNVEIPTDFVEIYNRSTQGNKTDWIKLVYGRYTGVSKERVVYKGNIAEAGRCDFWPDGIYPVDVNVGSLVDASSLGDDPLIRNCMREWMKGALCTEKLGYKLLDTFAWEIESGGWQAMSHSIFGLANEEFSPFGNRKILDVMLGVHSRYRSWPEITLEQEIVKYLWPELANFPYYSSWSMHGHKLKWYDGTLLNFLRKIRFKLKRQKNDRLV